jgi:ankyrin repeat protein
MCLFRQNALHTACACGNSYVVQKIFELSDSHEFLTKAYGKIDDVDMLKDHFIDCFVNTPDKNANNTPLHFACKNDHLEVVQLLLSKTICSLSPKNRLVLFAFLHLFTNLIFFDNYLNSGDLTSILFRYSQTPFEIASLNIKKTPEGKSLQNSEILD